MNTTAIYAYRFELLTSKLLKSQKFELRELKDDPLSKYLDRIAVRNGETWAVQVKYYRTARAQGSLLNAASVQIVEGWRQAQTKNAMLVVSCEVAADLRESLGSRYNINVIGRDELISWALSQPELIDELNSLLETDSSETQQRTRPTTVQLVDRPFTATPHPQTPTRGRELCQQLRDLPAGREHARDFEQLCIQIIQFLFGSELYGLDEQYRTSDGINRFDYVCRIAASIAFWRFFIENLGSQYVLFEFKNYEKAITQGQILTTEKYLLEKALRRVAIIISRHGANKNAKIMAQGAMREHSKLLLVINDDLVCEMLHKKDNGLDPTDSLFGVLDEFFMTLPR